MDDHQIDNLHNGSDLEEQVVLIVVLVIFIALDVSCIIISIFYLCKVCLLHLRPSLPWQQEQRSGRTANDVDESDAATPLTSDQHRGGVASYGTQDVGDASGDQPLQGQAASVDEAEAESEATSDGPSSGEVEDSQELMRTCE